MIIGITGRKRSGKNTFATIATNHLNRLGKHCWQLAFADELKRQVLSIPVLRANNFTFECIERHKERFRPILQHLGTEIVRELIDKDYWINLCMESARYRQAGGYIVFITDVRFIDEAQAIQKAGGHIIKINWTGNKEHHHTDKHKSETSTDYIEATKVLENDGTESFKAATIETINSLIHSTNI